MIVQSIKPSAGVWYYIFYPEGWIRESYPFEQYGNIAHISVWENYIAPKLASKYNLNNNLQEIKTLMFSMPRGRCFLDQTLNPNRYEMLYGNDIPSSLDADTEKAKLLNDFGLSALMARGLVTFSVVGHEQMIKSQCLRMQDLIGKILY